MSTKKIHTGSERSAASVRAFGHYALLAPDLISQAVSQLVVTHWSLPFNFCECENGIGYFIPSEQGLFAIGFDSEFNTVEINEIDLGLVLTLIYLNYILKTDTLAFSTEYNPKERENKKVIAEKYDQLHKYCRENLGKDAYSFVFND